MMRPFTGSTMSERVQTLDFFTPIVDDPYDFGRIAATNALSDVYAMGGAEDRHEYRRDAGEEVSADVIRSILRGGGDVVREAGCVLVGGHSIRSPEPIYGLSVTGTVHPDRIITNSRARRRFARADQADRDRDFATAIKRGLA